MKVCDVVDKGCGVANVEVRCSSLRVEVCDVIHKGSDTAHLECDVIH